MGDEAQLGDPIEGSRRIARDPLNEFVDGLSFDLRDTLLKKLNTTVNKFTLMEVNGELDSKPGQLQDLEAMRRMLSVLYEREEPLSPLNALRLGLIEQIPEEEWKFWDSRPPGEDMGDRLIRYFSNKRKTKTEPANAIAPQEPGS